MELTNFHAAKALGNLLSNYESDLKYITKFKMYKNSDLTIAEYLYGQNGLQQFINEYRVARNVKKEKVSHLCEFLKMWVLNKDSLNVDSFASSLQKEGITHDNKVMTSLSSKVLFLNNPENIIPIDSLNRNALCININKYAVFLEKVSQFKLEHKEWMVEKISTIMPLIIEIEKSYNDIDFIVYREIRFTDKLLWTIGQIK